MLNSCRGSAYSISSVNGDMLMLVISRRWPRCVGNRAIAWSRLSLLLPEFTFVGGSGALGCPQSWPIGLGCSSMCSASLCRGCGACCSFLAGEGILRRLLVELELDWVTASLCPSCCLLRCEADDAPCGPSHEWALRLEGCPCWLSECGPNRECMLVRGPSRECTLLRALRREYTKSQGPNREYTLPKRSVLGWSSGCLSGCC